LILLLLAVGAAVRHLTVVAVAVAVFEHLLLNQLRHKLVIQLLLEQVEQQPELQASRAEMAIHHLRLGIHLEAVAVLALDNHLPRVLVEMD
jgi:hypothetical protein